MKFAQIISYLFHPALMPTLGIALILNLDTYFRFSISAELKNFILGLIFVNTFCFPILILFFLKSRKTISSFQLDNRKERIIPFAISSIFFIFTYNVIQKTTLPPIILSIFLGITLSIISAFLISFFNKISIHMVGISGTLAALIALFLKFSASYFYEITIVVLVWGLVGFSRLKLKKHNHQEIYFGAFVGIICVFIPTYFGITI